MLRTSTKLLSSTCVSVLRTKTTLLCKKLLQQFFPTFFTKFITHLPYQVWFNSVAWFVNAGSAEFKL